jgi:hypothetical protein
MSPELHQPEEPATPTEPSSTPLAPEDTVVPTTPEPPATEASIVQPTVFAPASPEQQVPPTPTDQPPAPVPVVAQSEPTTPQAVVSFHDEKAAGGVTPAQFGSSKPKRTFPMKVILIVLAVLIVFGAGSTALAAYYVIPHEPKNMLAQAIGNSLSEQQISFTGSANSDPTTSGGLAVKVGYSGAVNTATNALDLQLTITVAGVSFPVEARLINQNLYFKVGDLSSIEGLLSQEFAGDPTVAKSVTSVLSSLAADLSNQWIEVDSTLLKQVGASCLLDTNSNLTKADGAVMKNLYEKDSPLSVSSTSSVTINGQASERYDTLINDNKAAAYLKGLNQLSSVKALNKCEGSSTSFDTSSLADGKTRPITFWVNKATQRVDQVSFSTTDAKEHDALSTNVTLSYGPISVATPSGAKSFDTILAELEQAIAANPATAPLAGLLGGGGSSSPSDSTFSQSL